MSALHMSADGIDFLENEEGRKRDAYRCAAGKLTIGVGHTGPVPGRGPIIEGMTVTDREIDDMLRADLTSFEHDVNVALAYPQVTQGQFDALISLAFNEGGPAIAGSTLMKKLNAGDLKGAAAEFGRWNKLRNPQTQQMEYSEALNMRRVREVYCLFSRRP